MFDTFIYLRDMDEASASVTLLGGEIRGETEGIEDRLFTMSEPITLITIAFLESIMPQRLQILQSLREAWPPRVNAQRGTTVLQHGTELTRPDGSEPQGVLVSDSYRIRHILSLVQIFFYRGHNSMNLCKISPLAGIAKKITIGTSWPCSCQGPNSVNVTIKSMGSVV